jgi:hypothetical protein
MREQRLEGQSCSQQRRKSLRHHCRRLPSTGSACLACVYPSQRIKRALMRTHAYRPPKFFASRLGPLTELDMSGRSKQFNEIVKSFADCQQAWLAPGGETLNESIKTFAILTSPPGRQEKFLAVPGVPHPPAHTANTSKALGCQICANKRHSQVSSHRRDFDPTKRSPRSW